MMNKYKCKHCGKIVERDSIKQWVASYCESTGRLARLVLIKTKE
jgi:ribosomal protein L37AE/L43A